MNKEMIRRISFYTFWFFLLLINGSLIYNFLLGEYLKGICLMFLFGFMWFGNFIILHQIYNSNKISDKITKGGDDNA